jgi:hypothetical protein
MVNVVGVVGVVIVVCVVAHGWTHERQVEVSMRHAA